MFGEVWVTPSVFSLYLLYLVHLQKAMSGLVEKCCAFICTRFFFPIPILKYIFKPFLSELKIVITFKRVFKGLSSFGSCADHNIKLFWNIYSVFTDCWQGEWCNKFLASAPQLTEARDNDFVFINKLIQLFKRNETHQRELNLPFLGSIGGHDTTFWRNLAVQALALLWPRISVLHITVVDHWLPSRATIRAEPTR